MNKCSKVLFRAACCALVLSSANVWAVGLERGTPTARSKGPACLSGITYAGGTSYYAIADNGTSVIGLYPIAVNLSDNGKSISSYSVGSRVELAMTSDIEGVAYDPGSGNVWVSDESTQTIAEYDPATGVVLRRAPVPAVMKKNVGNYGFESLTISGDGLTMWTANEEALTCDGARSSYSSPTTVRLVKFMRPNVKADWQLAAMYAYTTDKWHQRYGYGTAGRRGVSDLCVLPDGSLLVMERELSTDRSGTGWMAGLGVNLYTSIYRVTLAAMAAATDIKSFDNGLSGRSDWTAVSKTLMYAQQPTSGEFWLNYEGICLGQRLQSGNTEVLALTDAGDGNTDARLIPFALTGMDIRTLAVAKPAAGESSIVGSNFRHLAGSQVSVSLAGTAAEKPYAVDGTALTECDGWAFPGGSPSSGSGNAASFSVAGDGTFAWSVRTVTADRGYHVTDSFEGFSAGTAVGEIDGWSGEDCQVVALDYLPPEPPGFVMTKETHTRVLNALEDTALRQVPDSATATEKIDVMVCANRLRSDTLATPNDDVQIQMAMDCDGRLCLWHLYEEGGMWRKGWIPLSEATYADGTWIRIGVEFDYSTNPNGDALARVTVNGSCQPTAHGVRAPDDLRSCGAWHYLAKNRRTGGVALPTLVGFGGTKVDDLMICKKTVAAEHTGPTSADGIDFKWFDDNGLPRDPQARAPFLPSYTLADVYTAGIDPYSERPLEVTAFGFDADGLLHLEINGYRGDEPVAYQLLRSDTPDFKSYTVMGPAEGAFDGDAATRTTTWDGHVQPSSADGFYTIKATK